MTIEWYQDIPKRFVSQKLFNKFALEMIQRPQLIAPGLKMKWDASLTF